MKSKPNLRWKKRTAPQGPPARPDSQRREVTRVVADAVARFRKP
jgi:hypothetical protein